jgi:hypothetical protein
MGMLCSECEVRQPVHLDLIGISEKDAVRFECRPCLVVGYAANLAHLVRQGLVLQPRLTCLYTSLTRLLYTLRKVIPPMVDAAMGVPRTVAVRPVCPAATGLAAAAVPLAVTA